jgi:hypothetical protein
VCCARFLRFFIGAAAAPALGIAIAPRARAVRRMHAEQLSMYNLHYMIFFDIYFFIREKKQEKKQNAKIPRL